MSKAENQIHLRSLIAVHLDKIAKLFNQPVKITIVIRTPQLNDGGVLLTNDTLDEAMAEMHRLSGKQPIAEEAQP